MQYHQPCALPAKLDWRKKSKQEKKAGGNDAVLCCRGDYRTGKRLNMRKVIPYIASQFRKDKIWLRRTKPSKRQYQIMLAIDDSSSMADNHSKQVGNKDLHPSTMWSPSIPLGWIFRNAL